MLFLQHKLGELKNLTNRFMKYLVGKPSFNDSNTAKQDIAAVLQRSAVCHEQSFTAMDMMVWFSA